MKGFKVKIKRPSKYLQENLLYLYWNNKKKSCPIQKLMPQANTNNGDHQNEKFLQFESH